MADIEGNSSRAKSNIASSLILVLLFTIIPPTVVSAEAEDHVTWLAQLNLMEDTLGDTGEGYTISNSIWKTPHRTMLVIIGPEKPIDEKDANNIYEFVTERGGKAIIAADNANANLVAAKFGVTYFDEPMYDNDHYWNDFDAEGDANPPNAKNVWSLASIEQSQADIDGDGVGVMSESEERRGCSASNLTQHIYTGCRMPVMFRQPTGMKVEDNCANSDQYCEVKVLAQASVSAFIDVAGDGDSGNTLNPAPGDLALAVRIDYPGIVAQDYTNDRPDSLSDIDVTGSILFVSDQTAFMNRFWDVDEAVDTGMRKECDVAEPSCWQGHLTGNSLWSGNEHYFTAIIYSMMEFDNPELSNTVKLSHSNFNIVFSDGQSLNEYTTIILVAVAIVSVLLIIVSILFARSRTSHEVEPPERHIAALMN